MPTEEQKKAHREELDRIIAKSTEQLALLQYSKDIKGLLVLVVDQNHVFRLMEAYSNDTALAMNAALDIAKDSLISTMKRKMTQAEDKE